MNREWINKLHKRLTASITARILASIMVVFLPVCILLIFTAGFIVMRSTNQIVDSFQRELDIDMGSIDQNMKRLDDDMDDFVSAYLPELSAKDISVSDVTESDMLQELSQTMMHTDLPGYFYLYDLSSEKIFVKYQGLSYTVKQQEKQKERVKLLATTLDNIDFEQRQLNSEDYIVRCFSYLNYRVGFLFHLSDSIANQISDHYEDGEIYYLGAEPMHLEKNGSSVSVENSWKKLQENTFGHQCIQWKSEIWPMEVCVRFSDFFAYKMIPHGHWILLLVAFLCFLLVPFMWKVLKKEVVAPLEILVHGMQKLGEENLNYRIQDNDRRNSMEIQYLFDSFDHMATEIQCSKEKDIKMMKTELDNLRLQVNPHMLLNSFNMIYSLAQSQNYSCIQEYSLHLVDYFRYVLRKNNDFVSIQQELDFIQHYIEIQKIRYPKAFTCVYQIDESCLKAQIPPLLIENFIENSMKHALIPGKMIEVLLNIRREREEVFISVCDTGRGIRPEVLTEIKKKKPYIDKNGNKHIGIWNCMRRVELFYEKKANLSIVSTKDEGTQIFLTIPYREEEKNETANS